jgi:regulator of protease activity HflC (stomatin/prohibitin superfamily)
VTSAGEIAAGAAVELFFVVVAGAVLYRVAGWFTPVPKRHLVQAFQNAVLLQNGKAPKVVGPGAYWVVPGRIILCDMRPTPFQVPSQELLTADNMRVRVILGGEYRVMDPAQFITGNSDTFASFFLELRQALPIAAREMSSDSLFGSQGLLTARLKELLLPSEARLGLQVTQLNVYETVPIGWLREV